MSTCLLHTIYIHSKNRSPTSFLLTEKFLFKELCGAHCEHFERVITEVILRRMGVYCIICCDSLDTLCLNFKVTLIPLSLLNSLWTSLLTSVFLL